MHLTDRLQKVADLVPQGKAMADIGTDHGYLPIYLVETGKMESAIACDINEGPLDRAKENLISTGLTEKIALRLGGGLSKLAKGEVEGVTICGMGGLMICRILEDDREKAQALSWLVLQPQNHVAELKVFLQAHHFRIVKEVLSEDGGQLYEMLLAVPGEMEPLDMLTAEIGATPSYREDPLFPMHIQRLIRKRDFLIQGVAEDSKIERHRKNREKAVKEKKILETYL